MKTPEQIMTDVANNHSYDSWYELVSDCHRESAIDYTKEVCELYAAQFQPRLTDEQIDAMFPVDKNGESSFSLSVLYGIAV